MKLQKNKLEEISEIFQSNNLVSQRRKLRPSKDS